MAKIDDTWAEAGHRDLTGFGRKCPPSKLPAMAAAVRRVQNLGGYDDADAAVQDEFHECLRTWRRIKTSGARSREAVSRFVYRCDAQCTRDWSRTLAADVLSMFPVEDKKMRRSALLRLQLDYVEHPAAVPEGVVLSIPDQDAAEGAVPHTSSVYFVVVSKHVARQHRAPGRDTAHHRKMECQVSVQKLTPCRPPGAGDHPGRIYLVHDGTPRVVDLLDWAPWSSITTSLSKWTRSAGGEGVDGFRVVQDAGVVAVAAEWKDPTVPAWTLLRALADAGWDYAPPPDEGHTAVSARSFTSKDPVADKCYLRCLLGLPDLLTAAFPVLKAGQQARYYQCLLSGLPPESVPLGLPAAGYKALLASAADVDAVDPAASDEDEDVAALQDMPGAGGGLLLDLPVVGRGRAADGHHCRKRARQGGRVQTPRPPLLSGLSDALASIWTHLDAARRPVEALPLCDADAAAAPPTSVLAAVEDVPTGASSSSQGAHVSPSPAAAVFRAQVEGVDVQQETWGVHGRPGSYQRLKVQCPWHKKCRMTRSFSSKFGRDSGLGDLEPYAYLGRWLQAAADYDGGKAHQGFKPSVVEVQAYARGTMAAAPAADAAPLADA